MRPPDTSSRPSAFSLIELLSVLTIVTLLATLLLAVGPRLAASADASRCLNNLRTLGEAFRLYAAEHDQQLPAPLIVGSNLNDNWRRAVLPYVGLKEADVENSPFICPPIAKILRRNNGRPGVPNYGMNRYLAVPGSSGAVGLRLSQIERPSSMILATEATLGPDLANTVPYEGVDPTILMRPGNVHSGGNNLLMVGGNVFYWRGAERLTQTPYAVGGQQDMWEPDLWK